jgi:hypothetical protein
LTKSINGPFIVNDEIPSPTNNTNNNNSKNIINDNNIEDNNNNNHNCLSIAFIVNWIQQYFTKYLGVSLIKKIPELPWYDTLIASIGSFLAVAYVFHIPPKFKKRVEKNEIYFSLFC